MSPLSTWMYARHSYGFYELEIKLTGITSYVSMSPPKSVQFQLGKGVGILLYAIGRILLSGVSLWSHSYTTTPDVPRQEFLFRGNGGYVYIITFMPELLLATREQSQNQIRFPVTKNQN